MTMPAAAGKSIRPTEADQPRRTRPSHTPNRPKPRLRAVSASAREKQKALREIIAALMCSRLYLELTARDRLALVKRHLRVWGRPNRKTNHLTV